MADKAKISDDRIPFTQWQRHDEAAEAYFRTKALGGGGNVSRGGSDSSILQVKNDSGADRSAGHILEFTGLALTNLTGDTPLLWMLGGSPTLANGFGVLLRPIPSGSIDACQVVGPCVALVNVSDEQDKYARVTASTYVLQSVACGPIRILHKPSGTGEKTCAIHLSQSPDQTFIGKPDGPYTKGDDDMVVVLYDKYGGSSLGTNLANCILLVADVVDTDWVSGTIINGIGHAAPVDCA